jgi:Flp pilus assembly pilin Flp
MLSLIRNRTRNERGATAVEYSVMVGFIAAVIVLSVGFLGGTTSASVECAGRSVETKINACSSGGSSGGSTTSPSVQPSASPTSSPTPNGNGGNNGNGNGGVGQGNGGGNTRH